MNEIKRNVAPFSHHLMDFAFDRDGSEFESREHVLSATLAWSAADSQRHTSSVVYADNLLSRHLPGAVDECHWHAFDANVLTRIVHVAAHLEGREAHILKFGTPVIHAHKFGDTVFQTQGEMILVVRLDAKRDRREADILEDLSSFKLSLDLARQRFTPEKVVAKNLINHLKSNDR